MRQTRLRPFVFFVSLCFSLLAQVPRIGAIEYFGLHHTSLLDVQRVLNLRVGSALPGSKGDLEDKLMELPGVADATLEAVCCEKGRALLYVGIREMDAPKLDLRVAPEGAIVTLPAEIGETYARFLGSLSAAGASGETAEDLTRGYSLLANPEARALQLKFIPLADKYFDTLNQVLRESISEEQRAISAYVIGYASARGPAVKALEFALLDADETVRSNAVRALAALAVYAAHKPSPELKIETGPLIAMLYSAAWQERNNAAHCLVSMTDSRDEALVGLLRAQAVTPLVEMAKWTTPGHSLAACILLGRIGGLPEKQIQDLWSSGDKKTLITAATAQSN